MASEGSQGGVKGQSPLLSGDGPATPGQNDEGMGRDSKISISGIDADVTSGQKLKEMSHHGDALPHDTDNYEREDFDEDHVKKEETKNDKYVGNWLQLTVSINGLDLSDTSI